MFPQRSLVIQGSFPAGRPRVVPPVVRPGQPHRPVVQPAVPSYVTPLDPTRLNLGGMGGNALPEAVQRKMEAFYKTDFSGVRVHVGPQASSIGALAFTLGSNIYFAPGQYNPHSMHGQQLLGHELAHVLQQRAGRVRNPQGAGVAVVQDPHLEAEADRLGRQAAAQPMMPVDRPAQQQPGMVQATPAASLPGARPVAPHVQAAMAAVGQPQRPGMVQATPAASLPGVRPVAPHVQAALVAVGQPQRPGIVQATPAANLPGVRPVAPHVQAALVAVGQPQRPGIVQATPAANLPGARPVAPHVQAALAAVGQPQRPGLVQATPATSLPGARPVAPHVQAAVTAGIQPKLSTAQPGGRPIAPHVQAAITAAGQPRLANTPPDGRPIAPHVQAAVATVGQPKLPNTHQVGRPLAPHVQAVMVKVAQPKVVILGKAGGTPSEKSNLMKAMDLAPKALHLFAHSGVRDERAELFNHTRSAKGVTPGEFVTWLYAYEGQENPNWDKNSPIATLYKSTGRDLERIYTEIWLHACFTAPYAQEVAEEMKRRPSRSNVSRTIYGTMGRSYTPDGTNDLLVIAKASDSKWQEIESGLEKKGRKADKEKEEFLSPQNEGKTYFRYPKGYESYPVPAHASSTSSTTVAAEPEGGEASSSGAESAQPIPQARQTSNGPTGAWAKAQSTIDIETARATRRQRAANELALATALNRLFAVEITPVSGVKPRLRAWTNPRLY